MDKLIQRNLFTKTVFEIREDCLHFYSKGLANSIEYDISFEEISDKVVYETKMEDLPKVTIVCMLIPLFIAVSKKEYGSVIFTSTLLFLLIWVLFATRRKTASIVLYSNKLLKINLKKPNQETVRYFVDNLQLRIKDYLKIKYGSVDKDLPIEPQLNNYTWLKNRNIITNSEFIELKNRLLKLDNDKKIGFN